MGEPKAAKNKWPPGVEMNEDTWPGAQQTDLEMIILLVTQRCLQLKILVVLTTRIGGGGKGGLGQLLTIL